MKFPLVSIVINNYNYAHYLGAAIDSALAQTYSNCEVIVVDDGSTDNSCAIASRYDDLIQLVCKENGGQASAFNVGVNTAKGEWILLLDADDILFSNTVESVLELVKDDVVRFSFGMRIIDANGNEQGVYPHASRISFLGTFEEALVGYGFFPSTPTSGNLIRSDALRSILPMPVEGFAISADLYLFCELANHGKIQTTDKILASYRIHGANNYTNCGGRFDRSQKQLESQVMNFCYRYEWFSEMSAGVNSLNKSVIMTHAVTINALEGLSDAKARKLQIPVLDDWSHRKIMQSAFGCLLRSSGTKNYARVLIGIFSLLCNAIVGMRSHSFLKFIWRSISSD